MKRGNDPPGYVIRKISSLISRFRSHAHVLWDCKSWLECRKSCTDDVKVEGKNLFTRGYITFEKHVSEINREVMGSLMFINRVEDYFDKDTCSLIIQSLVLNILNYCTTIKGTANSTHLNDFKKLQNVAAEVVDGKAKKKKKKKKKKKTKPPFEKNK